MAELANFINIRVRGQVLGQQWQTSWNLGVGTVEGDIIGDWQFNQPLLLTWFDKYWNGGGNVPVGGGIKDLFITLASPAVQIDNVRVVARNQFSMQVPVQLELFGQIVGTRVSTAVDYLPSFEAVSLLARKDDFGGRGAAMRWPLGREQDKGGQYWTSGFITEMQAFCDALTTNASNAELQVQMPNTNVAYVESIYPVVVQNVLPPVVTPADRPEFPYLAPRVINAFTLTGWTLHDWVSTQNSRKIGRGR